MVHKISLMEVYVIETLRANGISDETIIQKVKEKKLDEFKHYHDRFDFTLLYELEQLGILKDVLENGYEIKFLTFTGLVNVLRLKFNKEENEDYHVENFTVLNLSLSEQETDVLKQMLSNNWRLTTIDNYVMIQPISVIHYNKGDN